MTLTRRKLVTSAAAAGLAACSDKHPRDVLRVAFTPITFSKMYEAVTAAFHQAHPDITVELIPGIENLSSMQRDFRLALVNDEPDVSFVPLHQTRFYAERDLAAPLDHYIAESTMTLTTHASIGKFGDQTCALPFCLSVPVTYFNNTLLARAGYKPDQMLAADWPKILEAASAVSRLGSPISGMFYEIYSGSALAWEVLVYGRGGRMMSEDETDVAFGDETGVWSAATMAAMGHAGQLDMSRDEARMAFTAGMLGSYHNTSSNMTRFSEKNTGFPVTVAAAPALPDVGRLVCAGNAIVITTRKPERRDAAWKYLAFATGPVGQKIMAEMTGYITVNPETVADAKLLKPYLDANPQYRRLYDQVDRLVAWYAFPGPRSEQIGKYIMDKLRTIIVGQRTPEAVLAEMVARTQHMVGLR